MDYDSENRKYAFCIINDELYKDEVHFECMINMLIDKGKCTIDYCNIDDEELKTMINTNVVTGEITSISNKDIVMFYNLANKDVIKKHFDLPMYLYEDGDLKEVI